MGENVVVNEKKSYYFNFKKRTSVCYSQYLSKDLYHFLGNLMYFLSV